MRLQLVGCSHHTTSIDVRERLAFNPTQVADALQRWRLRFPTTEAVLLSTCHRVEVYTATDAASGPDEDEVAAFLAEFHGLDMGGVLEDLVAQSGEDVVRHLFCVAASVDSMVVGEPQILAQVKQAYQLAQEHSSAGPLTHEIFQHALRVAKRVATETALNERRVSVPSVAIGDFAREIFERFDDKHVLVIGAGEMAEETLEYLRAEGVRHIQVVNRHMERAAQLAAKCAGRARPWSELSSALAAADLVVSTTGASEPIVTRQQYAEIEAARFQRPLFILDLAIPRDFDPAVGSARNVYLYSIDDLQAACARNRRERDRELPAARAIIEEETTRFMAELNHRATGPIIHRLREEWHTLLDQELQRLFNKLPQLDERQRAEIRQTFERYVNKLLHPPLESLRSESREGTPHGLLDALVRLFHLKD